MRENTTQSSNEEKQLICKVLKQKERNGLKGTIYIIKKCTRVIVLLTLFCWQACATADSDEQQTPDTNGNATVELALSVSVPQKQSGSTRQTADVIQNSQENYRDIDDLYLIPFTIEGEIPDDAIPVSSPITTLSRLSETTNYFYFAQDIELPLGTASFLGYAKARPFTGETENFFKYGKLTTNYTTKSTPAEISFELKQIWKETSVDSKATALAEYLTNIARTEGWRTGSGKLKEFYDNFTGNGSIMAGSSANVEAMLTRLWKSLNDNWTSEDKATVVTSIETKIKEGADIDPSSGKITLKNENLKDYPANINLPDGSASLRWKKVMKDKDGGEEGEQEEDFENSCFEALTKGEHGEDMNDQTRFAYPAELYYYVNSRIKTSASGKKNYYSSNYWNDTIIGDVTQTGVLSNYENDNAAVTSTTSSVALIEQMNYGVACMQLTVQAAAIKEDNEEKYYLVDHAGNKVYLNNNSFPLTGVFVGGQYPVDYKFETGDGTTESDLAGERIIYDKSVTENICLLNTKSEDNFTLVLQSKLHKPVNIVLEFMNNSGKEFTGSEGGIIAPGTHFYLTGKMTPSVVTTDPIWKQRVFTRDHKTVLNVSIHSLVNAYNVIPDLKTAQHELEITSVAVREWNEKSGANRYLYNW